MFKSSPAAALRHLEKEIPLGPNGIVGRAFILSIGLFALIVTLSVAARFIYPAFYQSYREVFNNLLLAPLLLLLYQLTMGIWGYLFRLANYVQTLRDFSVPNIEHMRVRLADLTPPPSAGQIELESPVPARRVPRPMDQDGEALRTRERNTLVALIGVLCKEEGIDYSKPAAAAATIKSMTASHGLSIGESTIEGVMKKIPEAMEARSR